MPTLKSKGNGLFIESFRTPAEHVRAQKDKKVDEVLKENEELKNRLAKLEAALGITSEETEDETTGSN